jgi:CBS domain-containing protein
MLLVRDLLLDRPPPYVLSPDASAREAAVFLRERRIGGAPVVTGGRLVGFCSERDLVFRVLAVGIEPEWVNVSDVMTTSVVTATPDDTLLTCEERLKVANCRHLPIVEDGDVVGCISLRDLLRCDLIEREEELQLLRGYVLADDS